MYFVTHANSVIDRDEKKELSPDLWEKMQDEGYFEHHRFYGNDTGILPVAGDDLEVISKFVKLNKEMNVVIIGCGYGREAVMIAPYVNHIYGIDVNNTILDKAVEFIRERGFDNFTPVLADNWKKQIPTYIDLVYERTVFQHITRYLTEDYISGLSSKLNKDGVFICQFLETESGTYEPELRKYEPRVSWKMEEIKELINKNDLKVIKTNDVHFTEENATWHWILFGNSKKS